MANLTRPPQYKFCPICGTTLAEKDEDGTVRAYCPNCYWVYYLNFPVAVAAVIWNQEKREVLLVQRGREPNREKWSLPAGFMEFGEHPEKTLEREIGEETGLRVVSSELIEIRQGLDDPRAPGQLVIFYQVVAEGELTNADTSENLGVRWWTLDDLPLIAWENHKQILKSFQ